MQLSLMIQKEDLLLWLKSQIIHKSAIIQTIVIVFNFLVKVFQIVSEKSTEKEFDKNCDEWINHWWNSFNISSKGECIRLIWCFRYYGQYFQIWKQDIQFSMKWVQNSNFWKSEISLLLKMMDDLIIRIWDDFKIVSTDHSLWTQYQISPWLHWSISPFERESVHSIIWEFDFISNSGYVVFRENQHSRYHLRHLMKMVIVKSKNIKKKSSSRSGVS
jgi:hypothetical protein